MATLADVILRDTRAAQPAATAVAAGTLFCVTDESEILERSNGTTWDSFGGGAAALAVASVSAGTFFLADGDGGGDEGSGGGGPGPAGAPGPTGATGATGPAGATIYVGFPGEDGEQGEGGMPGPAGAAGAAGGSGIRVIGLLIDGGGSAITTGLKGFSPPSPVAGTITKVTVLSVDSTGPATSGSIVIDVWKDTYANYPPTVADTITASAKPTLSSATKSQDTTLTGWTTSVAIGNIFGFNVDSATTVTKVLIALEVTT